jgi:hypothetical protein
MKKFYFSLIVFRLIHITIEINIIEKNLFYGTVLDCTSMYKSLKYVGIETPK